MKNILKKYWFLFGLLVVFTITLTDTSNTVSNLGLFLKDKKGPDIVVALIFFFSGLLLNAGLIKSGVKNIKGFVIGLANIFIMAPLIAFLFSLIHLPKGLIIGLFIVSAMPSTLSSGVVMTGSAGGNIAHALFITITANILSVFTIPVTLSILVASFEGTISGVIDKQAIMLKIGCLVILPLIIGLSGRKFVTGVNVNLESFLQYTNQFLILGIVWISVSSTKTVIMNNMSMVPVVVVLVAAFHVCLLSSVYGLTRIFKIGKTKRESVIFMGGQKTLPLSVILQVTLFPEYGLALVVCVLHHIVHLVIDGYLVGVFNKTS